MNNLTLKQTDIPNVLDELHEAFYDIPFENSDFQNKMFVVAAQLTPARALRSIGLRMFSKIQAVKEYQYSQELAAIDLAEMHDKVANDTTLDKFERMRLEVKIRKHHDGARYSEKLLNDSLKELDVMYNEFKKYPTYTREQFEAEEFRHFEIKLNQQLQLKNDGALMSLANMTQDKDFLQHVLENPEALMLAFKNGQSLPTPEQKV